MKSILFAFFFFLPIFIFSQHQLDEELSQKLNGIENFQEIKNTVLNHYQEKANIEKDKKNDRKLKSVDKQLKFWNRYFWMQENYVDGEGRPVSRSKVDYAALKIQKKKLQQNNTRYQSTPWILQGPTNVNDANGIGRVDVLAFHPSNSNIMFAGSPHGGLFKSTNAGLSWFAISDFLSSVGVAGIVIHPTNPDTIYVLSGNSNNSPPYDPGDLVSTYLYGLNSIGIYKTVDGGINWTLHPLPTNAAYTSQDLIIDPSNPETLIVSTSSGIFRSANGAKNWTETSPFSGLFYDLEFKPGNPNVVYSTAPAGFYKSTDNGISFSQISIAGFSTVVRSAIGVTNSDPEKVYIFAGPMINNATAFKGFYSSNNSGSSFSLVTQTPNLFASYNSGGDQTSDQSWYNIAIAVHPLFPNIIYVGGLSCWRSTDGGVNWTQVSSYWNDELLYLHADIHSLEFNPLTNILYCGNDGGVYRRENSSVWTGLHNGLSISTFYHFEYENDEGDLWGGTQDNGVLERDVGGNFEEYSGGDGYDVMTDHPYLVDDGESDDVYFTVNDQIKKDCNGGICNISLPGNMSFFGNLAMSPLYEDKIYVGYPQGLYRSENAGEDWTIMPYDPANWAVSSCPSNDNVVYYAGNSGNLSFISRNVAGNGQSQPIGNALQTAGYISPLKITDIDVSNTNHNVVYVSVAGTVATSKVFTTTDGGANWQNLSLDLPNVPMFCIKSDANGGIYVGTSIGVYYKRNGINHWEYFGNGLPPVPVTEIELDPSALPYVYVSTFGRGIWSTIQYTSNCPLSKTLTGTLEGIQYQEASTQINSTQIISGNPGTRMKYNTGARIFLTPGFLAKEGSVFRTYNTGCGGAHGG